MEPVEVSKSNSTKSKLYFTFVGFHDGCVKIDRLVCNFKRVI